jgi:DNA invertase Pin-like site-specific DNA recombinase
MAPKGNPRGLRTKAVAYIRTSSAANVGAEKDSDKRQRHAIAAFAKRSGLKLVGEFTDAAVSGADHIETRPGFTAMLAYIASNGARTIIVETARRLPWPRLRRCEVSTRHALALRRQRSATRQARPQ